MALWLYAGPSVTESACPTWVWVKPRDSRRSLNALANSLISSKSIPSTMLLLVWLIRGSSVGRGTIERLSIRCSCPQLPTKRQFVRIWSTLYSLGDSSRRSSSPSECSSSETIDSNGLGDKPILWCEVMVSCEEWLGWADSEEEEELLVPWFDMWWCWIVELLEVFGDEEATTDEDAERVVTALACSTGPLVIVSSPFEDVVNLAKTVGQWIGGLQEITCNLPVNTI